jgi:ankyrin repeat protein
MEHQTEAQARALEATLGNAASPASRRAVVQLARLPPALKDNRLVGFAVWDLGNLVRCALAAGASANARWGENDTPVLCLAAQYGSARSLKALLTGGADVLLADKGGNTALHWAAQKGHTACILLLLEAGVPLEVKGVSAFREWLRVSSLAYASPTPALPAHAACCGRLRGKHRGCHSAARARRERELNQ